MMGPAFGWNGTMIESGTPIWLDLGTTDLEAAKSFYRDLFGWNFTSTREDFGGYLMVDVGVPVGGAALNKNEKGDLDPQLLAWFTTYFKVDDIEADLLKLSGDTEAENPVITSKMWTANVLSAHVR